VQVEHQSSGSKCSMLYLQVDEVDAIDAIDERLDVFDDVDGVFVDISSSITTFFLMTVSVTTVSEVYQKIVKIIF
jgi:2-keto-3-deoxy-L-rhamnonate aldolase RhmA